MKATGEFVLLAEHVRGVDNVAADELSRGKVDVCSYCHAGQRRGTADGAGSSAGVDGNRERELVRSAVARSAAVYFRKGIAPKTERRYEGVWRRYEDLCRRMGEDPLPVTENKAIAHVVTVADEGVQASTVNHHLAGLRQGQIRGGCRRQVGQPWQGWDKFEGA